MNCANHPETPATAYCQYCGKPLCAQCVHKINNLVGCTPCLEARVHAASGAASSPYASPLPGAWQPHPWGTEPWVAFGLGWIPGVGAMYNGQFAKGLAHVLIFALLVDLTHYNGILGIVVAAWVIYQIFDAYQTAVARRAGLPVPNPLGLNDIGQMFGARRTASYPGVNPIAPDPPVASAAAGAPEPGAAEPGSGSGFASSYVPPYNAPPVPPVPPGQYDTPDLWRRSGGKGGIPTGAVVLIGLGVLFLLSNIGILSEHWLDRGWPILLIGLGVWLVIRHTQTPPPGGGVR